MTTVDFWFDPISPYAHLAFQRLPESFVGMSYSVSYRPIVFGALLKAFAHKGPAEIEPKRAWTFRQVHWLAHRIGVPIDTPARHPFNPIGLSRLAWATAPEGLTPSRHACEQVLRHAWRGGASAVDPGRIAGLAALLSPRLDPVGDAARRRLRDATDEAIAAGVFGVPTVRADGRLFWGLDALPMLRAMLLGEPSFDAEAWDRAGIRPPGVVRAAAPGAGAAGRP